MSQAADALMGIFGFKRVKPRTCKDCKQPFEPIRAMQPRCIACAIIKGQAKTQRDKKKNLEQQGRQIRKQIRERKEKLKTLSDYAKEAQAAVNAVRRLEDQLAGYPCISCGRHHQGQNHAGHYLSRGANPEISLEPKNIHLQCQPCNTHLSGNQINYRKGLIARYGVDYVEWLEGPHEAKRYRVDDYKAIKAFYVAKLKELRNGL